MTTPQQQAEQLIDLELQGQEWFAGGSTGNPREALMARLKRIDAYEADPTGADPGEVAWHQAQDAAKALWDSGAQAVPVLLALAKVVAISQYPISRRRVAADILSQGKLDGEAAEVMLAALNDPDPSIVLSALRSMMRVPHDIVRRALPRVETLRSSSHPRVAKIASIKSDHLCRIGSLEGGSGSLECAGHVRQETRGGHVSHRDGRVHGQLRSRDVARS